MQERSSNSGLRRVDADTSSAKVTEQPASIRWCGMGGIVTSLRRRLKGRGNNSRPSSKAEKRKTIDLVVLGASEAGKSTFVKQLRLVHGDGFSEVERASMRLLVRSSVFAGIQTLLLGIEELGEQLEEAEACRHAQAISRLSVTDMADIFESKSALPDEHVNALDCLWRDRTVRSFFHRRFELNSAGHHVPESCGYFLDNLARVCSEGYTPTVDDVLRVRLPTTGIQEYFFEVDKTPFRVFDVGGQVRECGPRARMGYSSTGIAFGGKDLALLCFLSIR